MIKMHAELKKKNTPFNTIVLNVCYSATTSLVAQLVKNPLAMQESPVHFLGQEDLLEKG